MTLFLKRLSRPLWMPLISFGLLSFSGALVAEDSSDIAALVNKAGSAAAGFAAVSKGEATIDQVKEKFGPLGDKALNAALEWVKDPELEEAPPAFRRYLYFDYMTKGSDIIAGASNVDELLINADASASVLFEDEALASAASKAMVDGTSEPLHQVVGNYDLYVYPMKPTGEKAEKCKACHASDEVGRPYPDGATVLGYTFVAIPK